MQIFRKAQDFKGKVGLKCKYLEKHKGNVLKRIEMKLFRKQALKGKVWLKCKYLKKHRISKGG